MAKTKPLLKLIVQRRRQRGAARRLWLDLLIGLEKARCVRPSLRLRVWLARLLGTGPRVGFGPLVERETTLGFRKWGIDTIIGGINKLRSGYIAGFFHGDEDLARFDILVIVKNFDFLCADQLRSMKDRGVILVYNPRDNPAGCDQDYRQCSWLVDALAGVIISNPLQRSLFEDGERPVVQIASPVINRHVKKRYRRARVIKLIWQGFAANAQYMEPLHPIIADLRAELGLDLRLVYHCERRPPLARGEAFRFERWRIGNWERALVAADVGVTIKPRGDLIQSHKPATKVLSYMGAGLPVVCTPSAADEAVVEHGRTGLLAYTDDDWRACLARLATDVALRMRLGRAAREAVTERFGPEKIAAEYMDLFRALQADPDVPGSAGT